MKFRKIRVDRLALSGAAYRMVVIAANVPFNYFCVRRIIDDRVAGALVASLVWHLGVNMPLYYVYHYLFARLVKLGRENGNR